MQPIVPDLPDHQALICSLEYQKLHDKEVLRK